LLDFLGDYHAGHLLSETILHNGGPQHPVSVSAASR